MMRREYVRRPSRAANWAMPPSVFAPVLAGTAVLAHRLDALSDPNFILVLLVSLLFAATGALFALLGLRALWRDAAIGGRRSGLALALCAPVLLPAAAAAWMFQTTAPLSDVSTDPQDPPHFSARPLVGSGMNVNEPPRVNADLQKRYYENVTGRRYLLSAENIAAKVNALVLEKGWQPLLQKPSEGGSREWLIEAAVKSAVLGFVDEVIIRVTDEGESAYVDMRSASRFGGHDLGANARRITDFMNALDLLVQTGAST